MPQKPNPVGLPSLQLARMTRQAIDLMDNGRYPEAMQLLHDANAVERTMTNLYNMGCCHALMGQQSEALAWLRESIAKGYNDWEHMMSDSDLSSLHSMNEFHEMVQELKSATAAPQSQVWGVRGMYSPALAVLVRNGVHIHVTPIPPYSLVVDTHTQTRTRTHAHTHTHTHRSRGKYFQRRLHSETGAKEETSTTCDQWDRIPPHTCTLNMPPPPPPEEEEEEGHRVVRGRWAPPPMDGRGPSEGQRMATGQ